MTQVDLRRQALREEMAARRRRLGPVERMTAATHLRHVLEQLPEFMVDERVAGYWACGGELPLNLAMAGLAGRGQTFYLPVIGPERQMRFVPWSTGEAVTPNRYGIPEPERHDDAVPPALLDVVLLPLLGFDRQGNRLGFGGGYYDASFAFLHEVERPATPLLVGIGYAWQECDGFESQPWDVRLDYVATDHELIDCTPAP